MPLIFIPISTLNYVGVPREKNNQVSGISNFMRNIGGSIGTSGLSVFLTRQNQTHQVTFASHTSMGDLEFQPVSERPHRDVHLAGLSTPPPPPRRRWRWPTTPCRARPALLSFKNSFFVMSVMIACLSPLPFIMRRPKYGERQASASH